jgi:hypothetical protein
MDPRLQRIADYLACRHDREEIDPLSIAPALLPHFFILDIQNAAASEGPKLYIRLVGTALDMAFGRSVKGRFLEDFLHGPHSIDVLAGFYQCARDKQPIWMRQVVRIADRAPRFVEGVAFPVAPARIYGGLTLGEIGDSRLAGFESRQL